MKIYSLLRNTIKTVIKISFAIQKCNDIVDKLYVISLELSSTSLLYILVERMYLHFYIVVASTSSFNQFIVIPILMVMISNYATCCVKSLCRDIKSSLPCIVQVRNKCQLHYRR